jgi:hypothetical protein
MGVRAKFYVGKIDKATTTRLVTDDTGKLIPNELAGGYRQEQVEIANIYLYPVVSSVQNSENARFFAATPSGQIVLSTVNPAAWEHFEQGKEFYVDFTPAGE